MKKFFTLIALCLGMTASAWADAGDVTTNVNIDFSNAIVDGVVTGTKGQMTIGSGSGAAARVEGGWLRQGDVTNTVTIPEAERAGSRDVVNVKCKMAWGNKNGMGSKFELKDADGEVVFSLSYCRWGSNSNNANINMNGLVGGQYNNAPILDRYTLFDITIDYAAKTITSKVSCTNPNASQTFVASLTNTNPIATFETAGFNIGGNTDRADGFDDLIITTTEGNYDVASADYIVKYVDGGGNEIKASSDARTGDVDAIPVLLATDKDAVYVDGKKYVYVSDNASSSTIANDNSTVVTVMFSEVAKYAYTINAVDASDNVLTELKSGETFTDENVTMYIPLRILNGTTLRGINGENTWKSYTINSNNQVEKIAYSDITVNNVVAYVEGENVVGAAECTPTGNLQLASCGHMGRGNNLLIGNVAPGKYTVTFRYVNTNSSAHPVTIKAGNVEVETIDAAKSSRAEYATAEFAVAVASDITFSVGGSSTSGVDYAYIVKTGDYTLTPTLNAAGYATFSAACPMQITGATAYKGAIEGETLVCTEIADGLVPAGEGVILAGEAGATVTATAVAEAPAVENNDIKATTLADGSLAEVPANVFALSGNNFVPFNGAEFTANKAYITYSAPAGANLRVVFGGEDTGIANVTVATAVAPAKLVKNGQIVVVKNGQMFNAAGAQVK